MKRWRRALWALVGLVLVASAAVWLARPWLLDSVERRLATLVADATRLPTVFEGLEVDLLPPAARVGRILVGPEEAPAAEIRQVDLRFDRSDWRLVGRVASLRVDPSRFPGLPSGPGATELVLPPWLAPVSLDVGSVSIVTAEGAVAAEGVSLKLERQLTRDRLETAFERLAIERGPERLEFTTATAELELAAGRVALRRAEVRGDVGSLVAEPEGGVGAKVKVDLDLPAVARFAGVAERVDGRLSWIGEARLPTTLASLDALELAGDLSLDSPAWEDLRARSARGRVALRAGRLTIQDLLVILDQGQVAGTVSVALAVPFEVEGTLSADVPDPAALAGLVPEPFVVGPLASRVELRGELAPLSLSGSLHANLRGLHRRVEGGPPPQAAAARPGALDAEISAQFRRLAGGTEAEGTLSLSPPGGGTQAAVIAFRAALDGESRLDGAADLTVADARRLQPLAPALTGGRVRGAVTFDGSIDSPRLRGEVAGENLDLAGTRFDRIGGAFEAERASFLAKRLEFRALGGSATLDGRVALREGTFNDWRVKVEHLELAALWIALDALGVRLPYLTGTLDAEASATGPWEAVALTATAATGGVSIGTERLSRVSLRVVSRARGWTLDGELARRPDERLTVAGGGEGLGPMWASAWSTAWPLSGFRFLDELPQPRGTATLNVDLYGRLDDPRGVAQLSLADVGVGAREIGSLSVRVDVLAGGVVAVDLRDDDENLLVEGTVQPTGTQPFSARAVLREFDLAHLVAPAQSLTMMSHGSARVEGQLSDLLRSLSGEIRLEQFSLGRDELQLAASSPIEIRARKGRLEIVSFELGGTYGTVSVGGDVAFSGAVALDIRVDADATVVEAIPKSPVKWASGRALLEVRVRRPEGGSLDLSGTGSLTNVSVDIGLPFLITEATGDFALEGSRIVLEPITGRAGGGEFVLGGFVDVEEGLGLTWQAAEVNSGFLDWVEDQINGAGEIRGPFDAIEVTGDILIVNALYDRDLELTDLLPVFRRELGPAPPKPGEKPIGLDLRIHSPDSIYIDNNIARAEFGADLRISGSDLDPRIRGEVELLDGEVTIFDRRFEITQGRIGFGGGAKVNPTLEFSANADVSTPDGEYNITAEVGGTLDDPRVKLSADDSSLTTNDVVTLLTVGKTMAQLQSEGGGVSAADLTNLAPMLYGSQVQRQVTRYLPIDRFSLEPGFSRTTGDFEPKVTVGTEIARGLRGTLSTTLAAQNQNSVQIEYQLTPSSLVVGSWVSRTETSAGGFGGAVKFRHRFRYVPFTLLPPEWCRRE